MNCKPITVWNGINKIIKKDRKKNVIFYSINKYVLNEKYFKSEKNSKKKNRTKSPVFWMMGQMAQFDKA